MTYQRAVSLALWLIWIGGMVFGFAVGYSLGTL